MASFTRRVFRYLWPYRWPFLGALLQVLFLNALELLKPWPLKIVIDNVLGTQSLGWARDAAWTPEALLGAACASLVLIHLLHAGLSILNNYTTIRIGQAMVHNLRTDLYSHLQRLSLSFYARSQVGDLLYRLAADTYSIQTLTMNGLFPFIGALVLLCGMGVVLAGLDWFLMLVALGVCPVLMGCVALLNRKIDEAAVIARRQESAVYSIVQRALSSIRVIRAFATEHRERRRFAAASEESLAASLRLYTLQTLYSGSVGAVMALGTAFVLWAGARQVLSGALSLGSLVVFLSYLASLYGPVHDILNTYGLVRAAKVGAERVFEILDVEHLMPEGNRTFPGRKAKGEVEWQGVTFAYVHGKPALQDVRLHVRPGEKVAIVGPTGAGKSTLLSLLARFYDPQEGRILLDGTDARRYRLRELRRQIAMVLQPPLVFPLTLRENIAYGRPRSSLHEIIAAARLARIHEFIEKLPDRYDTVVGEQGATLSEGEKQRLTIARALLLEAPILILDEPTSALDSRTEALILEGLERLSSGKTTLMIAHRLSTVKRADRIVVLNNGKIVEEGRFEELVRKPGAFATLYKTQFSFGQAS